jgi:hypothetical protein
VTGATVYGEFLYWMMNEEAAAGGREIKYTSASEYVRKLANMAREKYGMKPDHRRFFEALDREKSGWLKAVLQGAMRTAMNKAIKSGDSLSEGATPISRVALSELGRQLARKGDREAVERSLMITLTYKAAGRAGEVGTLAWDSFRWDQDLQTFYFNWVSRKTR